MIFAFRLRLGVDVAVALAGAVAMPSYSDLPTWLAAIGGALCGFAFAEAVTPDLERLVLRW